MRKKPTMRLCALLCSLALLCALGGAYAENVELTADMGYDGVVTYLRKLPVRVQIANHGGDADGTLTLDVERDERNYDRYSLPLSVAAGATVNAVLPVSLSTKQKVYTVKWTAEGETLAQVSVTPQKVLDPETLIVGVLSDQPQGLDWMTITSGSDKLKRGENWQTVALNRDTFPGSKGELSFFDMLVVDGVDCNGFAEDQKAALDAWLRAGGVILLGGGGQAATAFPFFTAYTGISAGALTENATLSESLMKLFGIAGEGLGQAVPVVALEGAKGRAIGEGPLADLTAVGDGVIFTASFSLSEKPLSAWMGNLSLGQRMLLTYAQGRYTNLVNSRSDGRYRDYQYVDYEIINHISVPNQGGMALPVVILAVFVALVGFGSYFILRAMDRREWMWATVPILCALGAVSIWGASNMLNLRKPIAVGYTIVGQDTDGSRSGFTGLGVASAAEGRTSLSLSQGTVNLDQQNDYYYTQEGTGAAPAQALRYENILGEPETLIFDQTATWEQSTFVTANVPLTDCRVSGSSAWEGNKLVFTVENQGTVPLSDGLILTDYGFVSVPALLPGQTLTAEMRPHAGVITESSEIGDGVLLQDSERRAFSFYEYTSRYQSVKKGIVERRELEARYNLLQSYANSNNWYYGLGDPRYVAFSDNLADWKATINGEEVTRTAQQGMFVAGLAFSPVSADGTVRFLSGSVPVSPAEVDGQGVPHAAAGAVDRSASYLSYRLNTTPVFAFDLSAMPEGFEPEHLDVAPRSAYYSYQVEVYSFQKKDWVAYKISEYDHHTGKWQDEITLPRLADCLDEARTLYVRFSGYGTVDEYADMNLPGLTMDGRLQ